MGVMITLTMGVMITSIIRDTFLQGFFVLVVLGRQKPSDNLKKFIIYFFIFQIGRLVFVAISNIKPKRLLDCTDLYTIKSLFACMYIGGYLNLVGAKFEFFFCQ